MYIYMTTNLVTGEMYIGKRSRSAEGDTYLGSGTRLRAAIKEYGRGSFSKQILAEADSEDELCCLEKKLIALHDAVSSERFYNVVPGGKGGRMGLKHEDDVIERMRIAVRQAQVTSKAYQAEMQRRRDAADDRYADLPEMLKTMSQSEAAEILGVDQSAVAQRVRDHNIVVEHDPSYHAKIQGKREAAAKLAHAARRAQGDATWEGFDLLKMAETMTQTQIGKIVGVSQVRVSQRLRELRGVTGPKRARSRKTP